MLLPSPALSVALGSGFLLSFSPSLSLSLQPHLLEFVLPKRILSSQGGERENIIRYDLPLATVNVRGCSYTTLAQM